MLKVERKEKRESNVRNRATRVDNDLRIKPRIYLNEDKDTVSEKESKGLEGIM